jgi:hypothetical protein
LTPAPDLQHRSGILGLSKRSFDFFHSQWSPVPYFYTSSIRFSVFGELDTQQWLQRLLFLIRSISRGPSGRVGTLRMDYEGSEKLLSFIEIESLRPVLKHIEIWVASFRI